jgi:hypothetical protein
MTRTPRILAAAAIASLAATAASALPPRQVAARPATAAAPTAAIPPEKAWLDFETGQFREVTAEDLARLERMRADEAARAAAPAAIDEHGHGVRSAALPEAYHLALAVREAPDGTLEIVCAPNRTIGRRLAAPPRPRAEER